MNNVITASAIGINWIHYVQVEIDPIEKTAWIISQYRKHKSELGAREAKHTFEYGGALDLKAWREAGCPLGIARNEFALPPTLIIDGEKYLIITEEDNNGG